MNKIFDFLKTAFVRFFFSKLYHNLTERKPFIIPHYVDKIEFMEKHLDIFTNLLVKKNFVALREFEKKIILKIAKAGLEALKDPSGIEIPYSLIGYYGGFVVGFVIEEILIAFFTAGTGNIAQAVNSGMQGFSQTIKGAAKFTKKGAKKLENSLEDILELLSQIRKGSKKVPKHLDDLENKVDELFEVLIREEIKFLIL